MSRNRVSNDAYGLAARVQELEDTLKAKEEALTRALRTPKATALLVGGPFHGRQEGFNPERGRSIELPVPFTPVPISSLGRYVPMPRNMTATELGPLVQAFAAQVAEYTIERIQTYDGAQYVGCYRGSR